MKRLFLLVLLLITGWCMHAAQLTESEAYRIAQKYNRSLAATPWKQKAPGTAEVSADAEYYVFNASRNQGFVIVSGDDSLTELVGYSDSGTIDMDNLPDNLSSWLDAYAEYVKAVRRSEIKPSKPLLLSSLPVIRPLLGEIQWNQGEPYNDMCPYDSNAQTRCPTGCMVTAFAQVMKYWGWPNTGVGSHSYSSNYGVLSADFTKTYDWSKMRDTYTSYYDSQGNIVEEWTQEEGDAVAQLMVDLGVAVEMGYNPSGSGATVAASEYALRNYFKYDATRYSRNEFSTSEFIDLLVSELQNQRPVTYAGGNETSGHAFVVDGCRSDGYFHVNWGWGGMSNGYFNINYMNPSDQGIGGSNDGYYLNQEILLMQPYYGGDVLPERQAKLGYAKLEDAKAAGLLANVASFGKNEPLDFTIYGLWNLSSSEYTGNVRTCVADEAGNTVAVGENYFSIQGLGSYYLYPEVHGISMSPDFSQLADGRYYLTLQSLEEGFDEWVGFSTRSFIALEVSGNRVAVIPNEVKLEMNHPIEGPGEVYIGENVSIQVTVDNVGEIAAVGELRCNIFTAGGNAGVGYLSNKLEIFDSVSYETMFTLPVSSQYFTVGQSYECYVTFVDDAGTEIPVETVLEPFRFTVMEGEPPRKQLTFGYYDTAESKGGITVENHKVDANVSQNVMIHNLTNYNSESITAEVGIALFDESGSLYKICNSKMVQMGSMIYTPETEIVSGFCSMYNYADGAYYFEAMSKEQYEGMSYDWMHLQKTSRIYVQKYGNWVYVYDPENYLKVKEMDFAVAPILDANTSVAVSLENNAYMAASGSLEYKIYAKGSPYNPLLSGTVDVNVATESTVKIPVELSSSQFAIGNEYELEISGYTDYADVEKTFIGKTLPFVVLDPSGVSAVSVASSVYPNPVVERVTVAAASPVVAVDLFSIDGHRLLTVPAYGQTSLTVDLSQVPSGVYVVIVRTENGTERHRVIKK